MLAGLRPVLILCLAAAVAAKDDPCEDLSSPQCCYEAYMAWTTSKSSFEVATETVVDYTIAYEYETFSNVPTTTLCDGFHRWLGPRVGAVTTVQVPASEPRTTWVSTPYPTPAPACTVAEEDCAPFMAAYHSSSEAYQSNSSLPQPLRPPCTTYSSCPGEGGLCKMHPTAGIAYYWPVMMEGDLCGDRTTITHPEPTRTTVLSGTTFVSPSVYISVYGLRANSHANKYSATPCGRYKSGFLLTMHPTDVSTYVGSLKRTSTYSQLNLADLNNPTPVTAYFGLSEAPDCQATPASCTDNIGHAHTPILSAPVQMFKDIDPDFEFCELHPSSFSRMGGITWIPLEPTQDNWPEPTPTSGPEDDEDDESDEDDEDDESDEDD